VSGRLFGIGVGPGDPELVTLKAMRALAQADLVVHFAKNGSASQARAIAAAHIRAGSQELPLFYGSYMHLHVRLAPRYPTQVIAGVTGMSGCWSAAGAPIAQGDDVFVVLPATLPEPELERRLKDADAAVVMKLGRHLPKIRRTLARVGRLERAIYVERGSTEAAVMMRLADKGDDDAPYFAIVLVPGWEGRA